MKHLGNPGSDEAKTTVSLENIVVANTRRIRGYGMGVTFTGAYYKWRQNASVQFSTLQFSQPTFS